MTKWLCYSYAHSFFQFTKLVSLMIHECGFFCSTDTGKETPEYKTLLLSLSSITEQLLSVPKSKDLLCLKFMERKWLEVTANPCEKDLVILALSRIEADSHTFHELVKMLNEISGMDLVVKNLTTKLQDIKLCVHDS